MDQSLAADIRARDRERWLSILWVPASARPALVALHAFDLRQQQVVADAHEALLAEIKLAWWREQIDAMCKGALAPGQPVLRALQADALPRGVELALLARMEEGFLPLLLDGELNVGELARARGVPFFHALAQAIANRRLDPAEAEAATLGGTIWAFARLLRGPWGQARARLAQMTVEPPPDMAPMRLAPALAGLVALALDDWRRAAAGRPLAPAGSLGRQWKFWRAAVARGKG